MSRNYSISDNPFIKGFQHVSFEITDATSGLKTKYSMEGNPYNRSSKSYPLFSERDDNYDPMTQFEQAAYYAGRTIRGVLSIPGALIDVALQALQSIALSFEYVMMKIESLARGQPKEYTYSCNIFFMKGASLSSLIQKIRNYTTINEFSYLARDLRLIGDYKILPSFLSIYRGFLMKSLF